MSIEKCRNVLKSDGQASDQFWMIFYSSTPRRTSLTTKSFLLVLAQDTLRQLWARYLEGDCISTKIGSGRD